MDMRFRLQSSRHERTRNGQAFHSSQGVGSLHLENEIARGRAPSSKANMRTSLTSSLTKVSGGPELRSSTVRRSPCIVYIYSLRFLPVYITRKMVAFFAPHRDSLPCALKWTYFVYCCFNRVHSVVFNRDCDAKR